MEPRVKVKPDLSTLVGQSCNQEEVQLEFLQGCILSHVERQCQFDPCKAVNPHCQSSPGGDTEAALKQEVERKETENAFYKGLLGSICTANDQEAEEMLKHFGNQVIPSNSLDPARADCHQESSREDKRIHAIIREDEKINWLKSTACLTVTRGVSLTGRFDKSHSSVGATSAGSRQAVGNMTIGDVTRTLKHLCTGSVYLGRMGLSTGSTVLELRWSRPHRDLQVTSRINKISSGTPCSPFLCSSFVIDVFHKYDGLFSGEIIQA
ncbi:hypothetical protein BDP55DRAFT_722054 [Colletotrichum godetiae]|uniref:Uncharacterized protein n=1 Tax=Colletotrichum godetiae TaxID=1209918 RepID=A0AAJ0A8P8_9PEZI|nr:uncharacterized protein BDP55DRAFT_722054 [Colletotrichum godetiae]KAK1656590.1 hypothetical protein BDP55DRAFT_722054 [Colletotrichum godetiae]